MIYLNSKQIEFYKMVVGEAPQELTAAKCFAEYVAKLNMQEDETADFRVCFEVSGQFFDDGYSIILQGDTLLFLGGKRGVIYAVFSFLEKLGFRFFTPELETAPTEDIYVSNFNITECSPFQFRDVLSNGATDKTWSLKQKLNSNLWNTRQFTESEGGGYDFAGIPAHSLTGEYLLKPYTESHPEYFSFKDGKRHTGRMGQICMTNEEAISVAADEVLKLLEENPDKNMVSVSQGDNHNFCECEKCKKAVAKNGLLYTYFQVVNQIARKVKEKYPHVLIHTFAYEQLCDQIHFPLEDNLMVQYCYGKCLTHSLLDESCAVNQETVKQIQNISQRCENVYIWNYSNCFKYELFEYPFIHHYLQNFRFFAETGIKGVFNEGMHREEDGVEFATTYELRSYLLSKLMWNPYMSKEEYNRHAEEFCSAFYGREYRYVLSYLDLYREYAGQCGTYDALSIEEIGTNNTAMAVSIIQRSKIKEFVQRANDCLNRAMVGVEIEQVQRIEKLKTCVLYYELYWTMRDVLTYGDGQQRAEVIEKNKELIQRIIKQKLVITFWGQTREDQNKELEKMDEIPPNEWNYRW